MREAAPEPDQVRESDDEPDLLLGLAYRLGQRLAGPQVAADRDVERARPGVLRRGAALEERERSAVGVDATDPDVERSVPVAVAMDVGARLGGAGRLAVLVENVERLVLRIGRRGRGPSESFEHVLERAVGDQLLGELVAARPHLALDDAVLGEPVLADPVEPR